MQDSLWILVTAVVTGVLAYSLLALIAASAVPASVQSWSEYIDNLGAFSGYAGLPTFNAVNTYMGASGMTGFIISLIFTLYFLTLQSLLRSKKCLQ
ncbi:MAG: hypothetical protein K6G10_04870 [Butyrivibrio sp.]|nr:hypothetical protein [Butyrivibrio sp.]